MKNIHVLPTSNPSRLHEYDYLSPMRLSKEPLKWRLGRNIYITNDEEIKEGDWFIHSSHKITNIYKAKSVVKESIITTDGNGCWIQYCQKIILTTDQGLIKDGVQPIPDKFLEWFVKNPSCQYAIVDKEKDEYKIFIPSVNIEDKIIIPKDEPKQETLEKVAKEFFRKFKHTHSPDNYYLALVEFTKQLQEKSYSEEDVREAFKQGQDNMEYSEMYGFDSKLTEQEWFEQFKKK